MRQTAQQTLERLNGAGEGALPVLVKLAHDETPGIRRHAIESLGTLRAGSPLARKALLGALQDPAIEVRLAAVTVLGEKGERARYAVAGLSECLKDREEIVRAAAKEALGKIDGGEPVVAPSPPSREPIW